MTFLMRVLGSLGAQLLLVLGGAVSTIIVARLTGTHGAGAYSVAVQIGALVVIGGGLGIDFGLIYFAARDRMSQSDLAPTLLWFGLAWGAVLAAGGYAIALALSGSLLKGVGDTVIVASVAAVPFMLAVRYLRYFLLGRNQLLRFNAINVVLAVAWVILVALALTVLRGGVVGAVWAYAAANVIAFAAALAFVPAAVAVPKVRRAFTALRTLAAFGLRAQLSTVLQFFSYRFDLFLLNATAGLGAAGVYSVATLLAESVWYIPSAVGLVLAPRVAAGVEGDDDDMTAAICRGTALVSVTGAIVIAVLAPLLVLVLFGSVFLPAVVPLWVLLPGAVALGLDKPIASYQLGRGRPQISLYVALLATPITIAAYVLLIPKYGIVGAATGSTISYVATTAIEIVYLHRVSPLRLRNLVIPRRSDWRLYASAWQRLRPALTAGIPW
jgi:O-antigen/teichoic acid export membrane protein